MDLQSSPIPLLLSHSLWWVISWEAQAASAAEFSTFKTELVSLRLLSLLLTCERCITCVAAIAKQQSHSSSLSSHNPHPTQTVFSSRQVAICWGNLYLQLPPVLDYLSTFKDDFPEISSFIRRKSFAFSEAGAPGPSSKTLFIGKKLRVKEKACVAGWEVVGERITFPSVLRGKPLNGSPQTQAPALERKISPMQRKERYFSQRGRLPPW